MHWAKRGIRILGIAESFRGRDTSIICGLVMRKDLIIDGCAFATITVGGMDVTEGITRLWEVLKREDLNCILMSGCIVAWFNIADPEFIVKMTGIPFISVTYEESDGLLCEIGTHFPNDEERIRAYKRLGERTSLQLLNGYTVYIRCWGIDLNSAMRLVKETTLDGKVPEPCRVARIIARSVMQSWNHAK